MTANFFARAAVMALGAGVFALAQPAQAQGSMGGSIGVQEKSVSGDREAPRAAPAAAPETQRPGAQARAPKRDGVTLERRRRRRQLRRHLVRDQCRLRRGQRRSHRCGRADRFRPRPAAPSAPAAACARFQRTPLAGGSSRGIAVRVASERMTAAPAAGPLRVSSFFVAHAGTAEMGVAIGDEIEKLAAKQTAGETANRDGNR